ncbi:MAG: hypothetical protein GY759_11700 [Chloroflexi bacterium]|nr:hypothetical protein [Chloroflexota bacterium]
MQSTVEATSKPLGVIDSIQGGFTLVNRRPWLLALPILLDLIIWLSPKLSIAPLMERGIELIFSQPDLPPELTENAALSIENLRLVGNSFNLFSLLAGIFTGLPSYLARLDTSTAISSTATVLFIDNIAQVLVLGLLFLITGLLIGSTWLALIVQSLDTDSFNVKNIVRRAGWIWLNTSLYLAGLIFAALALGGLLIIVMTLLLLISGSGGIAVLNLASLLIIWIVLWIGIGLSFVISAIALDGVNVARAVWRSVNVVGRNLPGTLGLLVISLLLIEGFSRIWLLISANTWGVPIGILGSAYIGVALAVASLLFYRARYQHWQRIRSSIAAAKRRTTDELP